MIEKNTVLTNTCEDGIWTDYKDHTWYFFIKDREWTKEEIQNVEKNEITVSFIQRGILDAFLLEIFDVLEPSDIPFCIKDGDDELLSSLDDNQDYHYEVVLVSEDNIACAVKTFVFEHENSLLLKKQLKQRLSESFTSEDVDHAYQKISMKCEPYELESNAVFTQKNRK